MGLQQLMHLPEVLRHHITRPIRAAHRQQFKRQTTALDLLQAPLKFRGPPWMGMKLNRIRLHLLEQGDHSLSSQHRAALFDQTKRADGQAAATAIASVLQHASLTWNCQGRANLRAGSRAIGRTAVRIKKRLAEMGVLSITEAHHQPRGGCKPVLLSPSNPAANSRHHRSICGHIKAMGSGKGRQRSEILEGCQIMVTGATNPLDPSALGECLARPAVLLKPQALRAAVSSAGFGYPPVPPPYEDEADAHTKRAGWPVQPMRAPGLQEAKEQRGRYWPKLGRAAA